MKAMLQVGALLALLIPATAVEAQSGSDPVHYSTPGWYRYIVWHSADGQEEWDRYIEEGPFEDKAACEATFQATDENNDEYCEYFDSDPEA